MKRDIAVWTAAERIVVDVDLTVAIDAVEVNVNLSVIGRSEFLVIPANPRGESAFLLSGGIFIT